MEQGFGEKIKSLVNGVSVTLILFVIFIIILNLAVNYHRSGFLGLHPTCK